MSILDHEFSDADVEEVIIHDSHIELVTDGVSFIHIEKDDAYALAKHFGLIDEAINIDYKFPSGFHPESAGDEWISVDDKPVNCGYAWNVGDKALAYGGYVFEIEWDGDAWCSIGGDDFTHWKPLPQSPKEQTK